MSKTVFTRSKTSMKGEEALTSLDLGVKSTRTLESVPLPLRREPPLNTEISRLKWQGKPPFVRAIPVSGKKYVQVVRYTPETGGVKVLESFGPENPESYLKAHLWKACFESLVDLKPYAKDSKKIALAVYGQLLGAGLVEEVLRENTSN